MNDHQLSLKYHEICSQIAALQSQKTLLEELGAGSSPRFSPAKAKRTHKFVTPALKAKIKSMRAAKKTYPEIVRATGLSLTSVMRHAK